MSKLEKTCPDPGGCESCPNPDYCQGLRVGIGITTAEQEPPSESVPIKNVQEALAYMQRVVDGLEAERDRYKSALERIAHQGLGSHESNDHECRALMGATGEPWRHWAEIARETLTGKKNT